MRPLHNTLGASHAQSRALLASPIRRLLRFQACCPGGTAQQAAHGQDESPTDAFGVPQGGFDRARNVAAGGTTEAPAGQLRRRAKRIRGVRCVCRPMIFRSASAIGARSWRWPHYPSGEFRFSGNRGLRARLRAGQAVPKLGHRARVRGRGQRRADLAAEHPDHDDCWRRRRGDRAVRDRVWRQDWVFENPRTCGFWIFWHRFTGLGTRVCRRRDGQSASASGRDGMSGG